MSTPLNTEQGVAVEAAPGLGRSNSVGETWRLVTWYLFTVRRRLMSKILLALLVSFFVISCGFTLFSYELVSSAAVTGAIQCPPTAVGTAQTGNPSPPGGPTCQQAQQQQAAEIKSAELQLQRSLTFPYSLSLGGGYLGSMGIILFCIMAAALAGGEYSAGTLRLALTRGTRRGQVIAAQVVVLAILSLCVGALILALAAIAGLVIGPLIGASPPAFPLSGGTELLLYWLANSGAVFAFSLIAFFMSTLSRNVIAGIAVALGYLIMESIVGNLLYDVGAGLNNGLGNILQHIPDYLVGYNTGALTRLAGTAPITLYSSSSATSTTTTSSSGSITTSSSLSGPGAGIDTLHGLLVVAVYCVLFVGLSYLFLRRRDVTE